MDIIKQIQESIKKVQNDVKKAQDGVKKRIGDARGKAQRLADCWTKEFPSLGGLGGGKPGGPGLVQQITEFIKQAPALLAKIRSMEKPKPKAVDPSARPMKFPYTYSAKLAQFPWKFYIQNNWVFRYYFIAVICCIPLFKKIGKLSNAPGNVEKWKEIKRKEKHEHDH